MKILNNKIIIKLIFILSGVLLCIGPFWFFKACDSNEKVMKCTYTSKIEVMIGIGIILVSVIAIMVKKTTWRYYLCNLFMWIESIIVPLIVIGGCGNKEMRCNIITFPCIYLIGAINIVINLIYLFKLYFESKGANNV